MHEFINKTTEILYQIIYIVEPTWEITDLLIMYINIGKKNHTFFPVKWNKSISLHPWFLRDLWIDVWMSPGNSWQSMKNSLYTFVNFSWTVSIDLV